MGKYAFSLFLIIGIPSYSFACKCSGPDSVEKEYTNSIIALLGVVEKIELVGLGETMNPDSLEIAHKLASERSIQFFDGPVVLKASLRVKRIFKGAVSNETIVVYTGNGGGSCGYRFEKGKEYLVYGQDYSYLYTFLNIDKNRVQGFRKDNTYWTNHCTRTTELVQKEQELIAEYLTKN
jgi:hypothetical protein